MRVIALHGDFASGRILRRDVGIEEWEYPDWKREPITPPEQWVAVGYSRGGTEIGWISRYKAIPNPVAAVLYEAPILGHNTAGGDFPVLWIENTQGARTNKRRAEAMEQSLAAWQANGRQVDFLVGRGKHVEWTWDWPPLRHGWDQSLNGLIRQWIAKAAE